MTWVLESGRKRIPLEGTRTFGRGDFPSDTGLSRNHIEISVRKGSVFAKDLGSSNGTHINGHKIAKNMSSSLLDGDVLKIGAQELTLRLLRQKFYEREQVTRWTIGGTFAVLLAAACLRPSVGFGLALFFWPLLAIALILAAATVIAGVTWSIVWRKKDWDLRVCQIYAAAVLFTSAVISFGFVWFVDPDLPINSLIADHKMEYFCIGRFDKGRCSASLIECPECSERLIRWKQDIVIQNMKIDRVVYDRLLHRMPANVPPAENPPPGN